MKILVSLLCLIFLFSCYKDSEERLYGNAQCDVTNVSYSADIQPIITGSCAITGCHVQGGSGVGLFENYDQVKSKVDNGTFKRRVVDRRDMPPSGPLSDCQIAHIQQWLADGAPNN